MTRSFVQNVYLLFFSPHHSPKPDYAGLERHVFATFYDWRIDLTG